MFGMMRDGVMTPMIWGMGVGRALLILVLLMAAVAIGKYIFTR